MRISESFTQCVAEAILSLILCAPLCVLHMHDAGVMDYVLADYTWARAVLLLGPTAATLGMSIQIPLATAADLLLGHPQWLASVQATLLTAAGTAAILAGVFGINLAGEGSRNDQQAAATAEGTAESSLQEPLLQPLHSQA